MDNYGNDKVPGLELAAAAVLKQAVAADGNHKFLEALTCYKEGIALLLEVLKVTDDESKKNKLRERLKEYMSRAEKLKIVIEREKSDGQFHEQIQIHSDSVGYSYERIFKPLFDDELTHIDVIDPYVRVHHQLRNFLRFCEMVVKLVPDIKSINLVTTREPNAQECAQQKSCFDELTKSLACHNVKLKVEYAPDLHDREIRLNNGWIVKIGRGLDYFKPVSKFVIGHFELDLRPCLKTTVDIFHQKHSVAKNVT